MNRLLPVLLTLIFLTTLPVLVRADTSVTGVDVSFIGQMGTPPGPDIAAGPGVRFGMELTPQGSPKGAPIVLTAVLRRPSDPEGARLTRWLLAARVGSQVISEWEFAYDWEVDPGVWTMQIYHEDSLLTETTFNVNRAGAPAAPGQDGAAGQTLPTAEPRTSGPPEQSGPIDQDGAIGKPGAPNGPTSADASGAPGKASPAGKPGRSVPPGPSQVGAPGTKAHPGSTLGGKHQADAAVAPGEPVPSPAPSAKTDVPSPVAPAQASPSPTKSGAPADRGRNGRTAPPQALGGSKDRQVYALIGGSYSEEARAMWMAAFFREKGIKACVRGEVLAGRQLWAVVTGWFDSREEAGKARNGQLSVVGDILVRPITAGELEQGLSCR